VKDVTEQVDHIVAMRDTLKTDRLNNTIYVLTAVATVLLVPTLIAGVYGMNFDHMPELKLRFGYLGTLIGRVPSSGGV
jgi:magnesium transporter